MAMFLSKQRTLERIVMPGGRRLLYGVGCIVWGAIIGLLAPTHAHRGPAPQSKEHWFPIVAWTLIAIGMLLLLSDLFSRLRRSRHTRLNNRTTGIDP
jgi:hypothetical protein